MKVKTYSIKDKTTGFIYDFKSKGLYYKKQLELLKDHDIDVYESIDNIQMYIEINLINDNGQSFDKGFNDKHEAIVFLNKVRRGNKLRVNSIFCPSSSVMDELNYYSKELTKCSK